MPPARADDKLRPDLTQEELFEAVLLRLSAKDWQQAWGQHLADGGASDDPEFDEYVRQLEEGRGP